MRIAYDVIMLREQTAVLHPEHLYNAMDHYYEMMRISTLSHPHLYTLILWVKLLT